MPALFFLHGHVVLEAGVVFSAIDTMVTSNLLEIHSPYRLKHMGWILSLFLM